MPALPAFVTLLSLVGSVQGVVLALALLAARRRPATQPLVALLLLGGAAAFTAITLSHAEGTESIRRPLEILEFGLWWLVGPLFYLYIYRVTDPGFRPRLFLLHFAPGGLWLAHVAWALASGGGVWLPPAAVMVAYQVLYTALALQRWLDRPAEPGGVERFWSRAWLGLLGAEHAAQLLRLLFAETAWLRDVVPLVGAGGYFALTFLGFRGSRLLGGRRGGPRLADSVLPRAESAALARRLRAALEEERIFLRSDLGLDAAAAQLGVLRTHLSQAVNDGFGRSFLEVVNGYRVAESRRLLADPASRSLTIEAIARRSGFNSRSAFYEAFRRETGSTPGDVRRAGVAGLSG